MAVTTDYDAPRAAGAGDAEVDSLEAIASVRADAQSPNVDLDEADAQDGVELPGADLSGEELVMPVIPKRADEFSCVSCFLVQHRSRAAGTAGGRAICIDCV